MDDVVLLEQRARVLERQVVAAERGARIAADEGAGAEAGLAVPAALIEREAHEGLEAAQVHEAFFAKVPVVQRDGRQSPLLWGKTIARRGVMAASQALSGVQLRRSVTRTSGRKLQPPARRPPLQESQEFL